MIGYHVRFVSEEVAVGRHLNLSGFVAPVGLDDDRRWREDGIKWQGVLSHRGTAMRAATDLG